MTWRIYIKNKPGFTDHHGKSLGREWKSAGLAGNVRIQVGQAYEIGGGLSEVQANLLASKLLTDPITQAEEIVAQGGNGAHKTLRALVWPKPGVSDPVADTVAMGARDLKLEGVTARSGVLYDFEGASPEDARVFCENFLMNPLVQTVELK